MFLLRGSARFAVRMLHEGPSSSSTQMVFTTGYSFLNSKNKRVAKYGVYFGEGDKRNTLIELGEGFSHVGAMIKALVTAVDLSDPSIPLVIRTDYKMTGNYVEQLKLFADRKFSTSHGSIMPNAKYLRELVNKVTNRDITFEYVPAVKDGGRNYVTDLILSDKTFRAKQSDKEDVMEIEPKVVIDGNGRKCSLPASWPVSYASAFFKSSPNGYSAASFCAYFPHKEVTSVPRRVSLVPVTLFRAQLLAIESAITEAIDISLNRLVVFVDAPHFIKYYKNGWLKSNNKVLPNKFLYERILRLATTRDIDVRFCYLPCSMSSEWEEANELCEEGINFPLSGKDKSEYDLTIEEMTHDNCSQAMVDRGVLKAVVFKKGTIHPAGIVFANIDGENVGFSFEPMPASSSVEVLLKVLKTVQSMNRKELIIRTDSSRLIKSFVSWLPVWKRNGWRNSQQKTIAYSDMWLEIYKLSQNIKIYWELIDEFTDDDAVIEEKFRNAIGANDNNK